MISFISNCLTRRNIFKATLSNCLNSHWDRQYFFCRGICWIIIPLLMLQMTRKQFHFLYPLLSSSNDLSFSLFLSHHFFILIFSIFFSFLLSFLFLSYSLFSFPFLFSSLFLSLLLYFPLFLGLYWYLPLFFWKHTSHPLWKTTRIRKDFLCHRFSCMIIPIFTLQIRHST